MRSACGADGSAAFRVRKGKGADACADAVPRADGGVCSSARAECVPCADGSLDAGGDPCGSGDPIPDAEGRDRKAEGNGGAYADLYAH